MKSFWKSAGKSLKATSCSSKGRVASESITIPRVRPKRGDPSYRPWLRRLFHGVAGHGRVGGELLGGLENSWRQLTLIAFSPPRATTLMTVESDAGNESVAYIGLPGGETDVFHLWGRTFTI